MGFEQEIKEGQRFSFGENWLRFLNVMGEDRINLARQELCRFLRVDTLENKTFLDVGSGSGLHSLAAHRLGAEILSFDYDPQSVNCTRELQRRYAPDAKNWSILQGSILDRSFVESLGTFDIVYSWGVLHHTGALWQSLYNVQIPLNPGGLLFIAIYNDQGFVSALWREIKRLYCSGRLIRGLLTAVFFTLFFTIGLLSDLVHLRNPRKRYTEHIKYRGMSLVHDWRDWLGGYPYQPARPDEVIGFFTNLGLELVNFEPTGHGFGNNQFLFRKKV